MKTAINEANVTILPRIKREAKQPWITTEILDLMKLEGKPTYREIDEVIKRKCKDAQEAWYNDKCTETESLAKSNNHCRMHENIKDFITESKGKSSGIDDITTEMLQALGEFGIDTLTSICNEMYTTVYIPEDLKTSVFFLLPKKTKSSRMLRLQNHKFNVPHTQAPTNSHPKQDY